MKACPFRDKHFCDFCELFDKNTGHCTIKLINWNLGIIAKMLLGDKKTAKRIIKDNLEK